MSKFFSWLGTILVTVLIIAAITAPGDKKFENFMVKNKGGVTMSCKPIIGKSSPFIIIVRLFSFHYVSYCETTQSPFRLRTGGNRSGETDSIESPVRITLPKVTARETYLGLFGRFWKL
jgi:hypothetical protein